MRAVWKYDRRRIQPELLAVYRPRKRRHQAFHRAVTDSFGDHALIQRCRQHKKRNVSDALPQRMRSSVLSAMSQQPSPHQVAPSAGGDHDVPVLTSAFSITASFRMHATSATFEGFPAA